MSIPFDKAESKFKEVVEFLGSELVGMRAGRASPALVENIQVEAYSQKMPLNQLANIIVVDATLITVKPWDKATIDAIEKALKAADLGIKVQADGEQLRLPIPPLTEERRQEYVKLMKTKLEESRIAIRQIRKDVLDGLEADQDRKLITEDDHTRLEKELQGLVDKYNDQIKEIGKDKEAELLEV
ncbi:MAG: ribosome recycling factor [Candidatus Dojkabacteria bacterium]